MNGSIDWLIFDYKFGNKKYEAFEQLVYLMFHRTFCEAEGLQLDNKLIGLEADHIVLSNGKAVGFLAKYCEKQTLNARQLDLIKTSLIDVFSKYPLDDLFIYTNSDLPQSSRGNFPTVAEINIEKAAEELKIKINWMTRSKIEKVLSQPDMSDLYSSYFAIYGVCDPQYWRKTNTLYKYMSLGKLEDAILNGVSTSYLGFSNPLELEGVENPNLYRKCCMTNSSRQMLLWAYYGSYHRGCCVEFDVSGIDRVLLRKVNYTKSISSHEDMTPKEICEDLYNVGKEWEHENEYRAVFYKRNYNKSVWNVLDDRIYLKAKVKAVTFGLFAEENVELYLKCLELLKRNSITTKKCRIRSSKYELTDDPQFDIESEIEKVKERKEPRKGEEKIIMKINNYGVWNGDVVEGDKIINNSLSTEDMAKLTKCIEDNNISKEDVAAVVSVLEEINKSQNDFLTEYTYMASEMRNSDKSKFTKNLQEKIKLTNGILSLTNTIGTIAMQHPEAIQAIAGFLGNI